MHAGAAVRLSAPSLVLSDEQAAQITKAGQRVARHYDIAILDPKMQDWLMFGGVLAKIYGGMAMDFIAERRAAATIAPPVVLNGTAQQAEAMAPSPVLPEYMPTGPVN